MPPIQINTNLSASMPDAENPLLNEFATRTRADLSRFLYYLPNPDPVLKRQGKDISVYRDLTYDPHVSACIQSFKDGVKKLEWGIDRGGSKNELTETFEKIFAEIDESDETGGIPRIIGEILEARLFGYQPLEVMWTRVGNLILPSDIIAKPQEWFEFDENNNLMLRGIGTADPQPVPDMKFITPRFEGSYANPYGRAVLSSCFWAVTFKKGGMKFFVQFTEKYGMPWAIGKHSYSDQNKIDSFRDEIDALVADAVAVIPNTTSLDLTTPNPGSAEVYDRFISVCKADIAQAILSHTGAVESTAGRLGNDSTALEVREGVINSGKTLVEQVMNVMIRWTCKLNGWTGTRPRFAFYEEEDVDLTTADRDSKLYAIGWRPTRAYLRSTYGFKDEDFTLDENDTTTKPDAPSSASGVPASFSAGSDMPDADQIDELTKLSESLGDEDIMTPLLDPIFRASQKAKDLQSFRKSLSDLFDEMDASPLEKNLAALTFAANAIGRSYANED